jgi:hypothetical protein
MTTSRLARCAVWPVAGFRQVWLTQLSEFKSTSSLVRQGTIGASQRRSDRSEFRPKTSFRNRHEQRELAHAKNVAGMAGGWGRALVGAKSGASGEVRPEIRDRI